MNENQRAIFGNEYGYRLALETSIYVHAQKYPEFKEWAYMHYPHALNFYVIEIITYGIDKGLTTGHIFKMLFDKMDEMKQE